LIGALDASSSDLLGKRCKMKEEEAQGMVEITTKLLQ